MEFTEEFIKENELNENQIKAITGYVQKDYIPALKKEWDGKADENTNGILDGIVKSLSEKHNVQLEREKGEKWADYLTRVSEVKFANDKSAIEKRQLEIDDKLKNFKGSDDLKKALEAEQLKNDELLKKVAEYEPLKGLKEKYESATEELSGLKLNVAFNNIKPNFPPEVNPYEAKAKWEDFKKGVLDKHNIELVDGEPIAIDKENHHKTIKLSELLSQDANIKELLQGRQQQGTGAQPANLKDVEGVPFKVPENATSEERSKLIREYLASTGISSTSPIYASKFSELNLKIAKAKQTA